MRNALGASLFGLLTTLSLGASAETTAGPPKPGKCSVSAAGVGSEAGTPTGLGLALTLGATLALARRSRRSR